MIKKSTHKKREYWMFWILVLPKSIFSWKYRHACMCLGRRLRMECSDKWLLRCQTVPFHVLFSKCYSPAKFLVKLHERNHWWIFLQKALIYCNTQVGSSVKFMLNTVCPLLEFIPWTGSDITEPRRRGSPCCFSVRIVFLTWVLKGILVWVWNTIL